MNWRPLQPLPFHHGTIRLQVQSKDGTTRRVYAAVPDFHMEEQRWLIASGGMFVKLLDCWTPTGWLPLEDDAREAAAGGVMLPDGWEITKGGGVTEVFDIAQWDDVGGIWRDDETGLPVLHAEGELKDWPSGRINAVLVQVSRAQPSDGIIEAAPLPQQPTAERAQEVWVNRCPVNHARTATCPRCHDTRPPGAKHGEPVTGGQTDA